MPPVPHQRSGLRGTNHLPRGDEVDDACTTGLSGGAGVPAHR